MNENENAKSKIESEQNQSSENNDQQFSVKKTSRTNHRLAMSNKSCQKHAKKWRRHPEHFNVMREASSLKLQKNINIAATEMSI